MDRGAADAVAEEDAPAPAQTRDPAVVEAENAALRLRVAELESRIATAAAPTGRHYEVVTDPKHPAFAVGTIVERTHGRSNGGRRVGMAPDQADAARLSEWMRRTCRPTDAERVAMALHRALLLQDPGVPFRHWSGPDFTTTTVAEALAWSRDGAAVPRMDAFVARVVEAAVALIDEAVPPPRAWRKGDEVRHVGHGHVRGEHVTGLGWSAVVVCDGTDVDGGVRCQTAHGEERAWQPRDLELIRPAAHGPSGGHL